MKTVIAAINSKYIHSALAAWYLKAACGEACGEVCVREYTINDSVDSVFADIYLEKPDVVAFSCYIWNMTFILAVAENLKEVRPDITVIFGGPEVSFGCGDLMNKTTCVDFVLAGEGEESFRLLLESIARGSSDYTAISGISYRQNGEICYKEEFPLVNNLDEIQTPYTEEMLASLENRIVYYESSRGCPYSCSYCISSTFKGVRYFSMERVKQDLDKLINSGVKQIKFVDRTFNCNKQRAKEIFRFIIMRARGLKEKGMETKLNFHFEVAADLFDNEMFEILCDAPKGLIQFEIGIQTTNLRTLELISRKTDLNKVFCNIQRLKELGNMHIHLDLIAGLPEEDYKSFKASFNMVHSMKPDQLQLGFLKLLKGSRIREEAAKHGYKFRSYPVYEILENDYLTVDELLQLKGVEEVVERYYNSGRFVRTLTFVVQRLFSNAFELYESLSQYMKKSGYMDVKLSSRQLYTILIEYLNPIVKDSRQLSYIKDLLKLDFLSSDNSNNLPQGLDRVIISGFKEKCFEFLKNTENIDKYLGNFTHLTAKQIIKEVHFEVFNYDVSDIEIEDLSESDRVVVLFDYSSKDRVTSLYEYKKLPDFF